MEAQKLSRIQRIKAKVKAIFRRTKTADANNLSCPTPPDPASTRSSKSSEARPTIAPTVREREDSSPRQRGFVVTDTRLIVSKQCKGLCIRQEPGNCRSSKNRSRTPSSAIDDDLVDSIPLRVEGTECGRDADHHSDDEIDSTAHRRIVLHNSLRRRKAGDLGRTVAVSPDAVKAILHDKIQQRIALSMLLNEACRHAFMVGYFREYVTATLRQTSLDLELYKFQFDCDWKPLLEDVKKFLDEHVPLDRTGSEAVQSLAHDRMRSCVTPSVDEANPVHMIHGALQQLDLFERISNQQQFVSSGLREIHRLLQQQLSSAQRNAAGSPAVPATSSKDDERQSSSVLFEPSSECFTVSTAYSPRSRQNSRRCDSVFAVDPDEAALLPYSPPAHLPLRLFLDGDRKAVLSHVRRQNKLKIISVKPASSSSAL